MSRMILGPSIRFGLSGQDEIVGNPYVFVGLI
jgi:hypothetical protein